MGLLRAYLCFFLLFIASFVYSQNIKFKHITNEDGLSSIYATTLLQDPNGFIWIGTQDGLNRYDGYHFKVFKYNSHIKTSIGYNDIKCLYMSKDGTLLIGTNGGGLSVYDKYTETFKNYKAGATKGSLSANNVNSIAQVSDKEFLIGTSDGLNLFNIQTGSCSRIDEKNGDTEFYINRILVDSQQRIWIATYDLGLYLLDLPSKTLENFRIPVSLYTSNHLDTSAQSNILTLCEINRNIWCGTDDDGIKVFDTKKNTFVKNIEFETHGNRNLNRIKSFLKDDASNSLWIGTWYGIIHFNLLTNAYTLYNNDPENKFSISDNAITDMLYDDQQNLWISTENLGVNIFFRNSLKFPCYDKTNNLNDDFVYSFLEMNDDSICIGTSNGIYSLNKHSHKIRDISHLLSKEENAHTVLSMMKDSRNRLWIGTYGQGVIIYDPATKTYKSVLGQNNLGGSVTALKQLRNGMVAVGTYRDGFYLIDPENLNAKRFTTKEGLSSNNIYSIYEEASTHKLWLGTQGGGISIMTPKGQSGEYTFGSLQHIENKNSLSSNTVNNIYKDKNGIFWIATTAGLNKYDPKAGSFEVYSEDDGLPNTYIYDVIPDKAGNFWLPTNLGLSRFNPNIKNEHGSAFRNYTTKDGIQGREFNQGASFLCNDGMILVGGVSGFNYFHPESIHENMVAPRSYIYSYSRQGREISSDTSILFKKHLELTYRENYFTFELITLGYIDPAKNKYMYMLEGYDNDWSSPSNVRYVSYTELPGGTYTFKVKASNSDGVWHEVPYTVSITVIPPWWRTTWFYILAALLVTGLVFGFISYRTNAVKKENKILENKVSERTKELAEKNRDITSSIEYAKRIQEAILPSKDLIFSKLKNAFILYKPKDIVSGDFYWFGERNNLKIMAVVDCTGHGVPGAFMSMIGHNLLNQIVLEKGYSDPGAILTELHKGVQTALKQGSGAINTNDGMDASIIALNTDTNQVMWAGAFRNLIIISNEGELEKIDGNKYPVGGAQLDTERVFTTHHRHLKKHDALYMFSDGYADQFGGEKGKKFMVKKFHEVLQSIHQYGMTEQYNQLNAHFEAWRGTYEQVDDVLVVGIKI